MHAYSSHRPLRAQEVRLREHGLDGFVLQIGRVNHQELRREIEQRKLRAAKAALRRKVDILGDCRIGLALAKEGVLLKSL